jgi:hypothetical protein
VLYALQWYSMHTSSTCSVVLAISRLPHLGFAQIHEKSVEYGIGNIVAATVLSSSARAARTLALYSRQCISNAHDKSLLLG